MKCNSIILIIFLVFTVAGLKSQNVTGLVKDNVSGLVLENASIHLEKSALEFSTDAEGKFHFSIEEAGRYTFSIKADGYEKYFSNFTFRDEELLDLGIIYLYPFENLQDKDMSYLSETDIAQSEESTEVVSLLTASRDEFSRTAAFDFGVARFRMRGYHPNYTETFFNGMPANDLEDGYSGWALWGGLNDVTRRQQSNYNMEPSFFAFGGLGGSNHISTLASDQYKQTRASFSLTNRSYTKRAMLTYSTGMLQNGWAFSFSGSRRWGDEGYIEATFYDAYSYFASIDKKFNDKHLLNLSVLNAPNTRGKSSGAVQEIYDITGDNYYNSYWGWQDGKKRNSRVASSSQPLAVLRHVWTPNDKTSINSSFGVVGGRYGQTRLDWFNAADPRPNYYRNLPSYKEDPMEAALLTKWLAASSNLLQVNWDKMYEINQLSDETIYNVGGIEGNDVTGMMSQYIIEEQREDPLKFSFNSYIQTELSNNISLFGGLSYQNESVHHFKMVNDLLGGEFYLDLDKYAERDFPNDQNIIQNDLNRPNRIVYEGDTLGFNYIVNTSKAKAWGKSLFVMDNVDFFLAADISYTSFYRDGKTVNGKFPESSFGKSQDNNFLNYGLKSGATYKLDGRNYVYYNGMYMTRAPYARNAFISPRTRDHVVDDLKSELIYGGELGYDHKSPYLTLKATAYYTKINDQTRIRSFYHDDEASFVNYILTGIDQTHIGTELAAKVKISPTFSAKGVVAFGDYYYSSRPEAIISQDNNAEVLSGRTIYMKNFKINGTPQKAYSLALSYNSPKYWFLNLSFNYFDDIYLDFNPERRTNEAVDGLDKEQNPDLWYDIISQEKLDSDFIVNFFGGKSWKINDYYLYLQLGVNNLLNNTGFRTGGYEQLRFDYDERDVNAYPARYFYAYGATYYLNISFRI